MVSELQVPLACTLRRPRHVAPSSLSLQLVSWQHVSCWRKGHGSGLPRAFPSQASPRHCLPSKAPHPPQLASGCHTGRVRWAGLGSLWVGAQFSAHSLLLSHRHSRCPTLWPTSCTAPHGGFIALRPSATTSWSLWYPSSSSSDGGCASSMAPCRSYSRLVTTNTHECEHHSSVPKKNSWDFKFVSCLLFVFIMYKLCMLSWRCPCDFSSRAPFFHVVQGPYVVPGRRCKGQQVRGLP